MKLRHVSLIVVLALAGGTAAVRAQTQTVELARYQVIITQSPFGPLPSETHTGLGDAPAPFAAKYQLVGLVSSNCPEQTLLAVIFDKGNNRCYFKAEGEMLGETNDSESVKVVRIEREPAKLVLQHGLETSALTFVERSNQAGPGPGVPQPPGLQLPPGFPAPGAAPTAPPGFRRIPTPFRRGT